MPSFIPQNLKRWSMPQYYFGASWPDYFVFLGRTRDSDAPTRANFDAGLKAIGGEQTSDLEDQNDESAALSLVTIVRENHWACGWVEWIAIHQSANDALAIADQIKAKLEDYPVVDEQLMSEYEEQEALEVWQSCYRPAERIAYIREHRSQFDFRSFADLLGCVRGNYFAGYASELIA